ncbi:MAG: acyl-ACP thioesterase [Bacteroidota bacterium]|jgi:acyl-CoA thioester hydrolase|nr:acyl-ACP thioesterase [Bacteroidota bacterium]
MENISFEQTIRIYPTDIDENGHVNNIVYLKWVQDIAIAHWNSVATQDMKTNLLWVVSRHEIDYLKSAYLDSKLTAKTWVTEPNGAKSDRHVVIYEAETNSDIAKIKTTWYLLDVQTKRPKRIESDIANVFHNS